MSRRHVLFGLGCALVIASAGSWLVFAIMAAPPDELYWALVDGVTSLATSVSAVLVAVLLGEALGRVAMWFMEPESTS